MADRGGAGASERMTDTEALLWTLDADPALRSSFASLTLLDRPPDLDLLRRRMARAAERHVRLAQRVVSDGPWPRPPRWEPDPDFAVEAHVRRFTLSEPADLAQACEVAAHLARSPLDPSRPQWDFLVLEGLPGQRAALVQRFHHAITDGEGGVRLSTAFLDAEREPHRRVRPTSGGGQAAAAEGEPPPPAATPGGLRRVPHALGQVGTDATRALDGFRRHGTQALSTGLRLPRAGAETVADTAGSLQALAANLLTDRSRSPLWTARSSRRHLEILRVPLEPARAAARAQGATLNDLFLAVVATAAGAYHRKEGAPVEELRVSLALSTRTDRSAGGNAFTVARVLLPTCFEDPLETLAAVRQPLAGVRRRRHAHSTEAIARALRALPPPLLVRLARQQVATVDLATSNVRAAPFPLYVAGARIVSNHPLGPVAGTATNITMMSYDGGIDVGLHVDPAAVRDPALLRDLVEDGFARCVDRSPLP